MSPSSPDLAARVAEVLSGIEPMPKLYVGLSGGVDSTALLLLCARWGRVVDTPIIALHANHQLQSDADAWQQHCQALCEVYQIEFIAKTLELSAEGNLEAEARAQRYAFFESEVAEGAYLALAHHGADQSETAMLRLMQGRGLMAMKARSKVGGLKVVRPLLGIAKQQLIDYVSAVGEAWIEDISNLDVSLDRNYLRHRVMPALYGRWPNLDAAVSRVVAYQSSSELAIQNLVAHLVQAVDAGGKLPVDLLAGDPAVAIIILRAFANQYGLHETTDRALNEFIKQCQRADHARLDVGGWSLLCRMDKNAGQRMVVVRRLTEAAK